MSNKRSESYRDEDGLRKRLSNRKVNHDHYQYDLSLLCENREPIPFAILYETAHFGEGIGIVDGHDNRQQVLPLITAALNSNYDLSEYQAIQTSFQHATEATFEQAAQLHGSLLEWDKQSQYEGHAQLIFRLKDQFAQPVEHFDITINSGSKKTNSNRLEDMIEDKHSNNRDKGAITFYLRTQKFDNPHWLELLDKVTATEVEITGYETLSNDIDYIPLTISLNPDQIRRAIQSFRTTIFDIELMRLPSEKVFSISKAS